MIDIKAEKRRYAREALKAKLQGDIDRAEFYYGMYKGAGEISMYIGSDAPGADERWEKEVAEQKALFEKYGEKHYVITLDI